MWFILFLISQYLVSPKSINIIFWSVPLVNERLVLLGDCGFAGITASNCYAMHKADLQILDFQFMLLEL